ncbi:hypothetical protein Bca52824_064108 [Brassica carinata]|uniref:Uncharacterized protein n=1 Tax=Brassica carinata TaxID=52824 RepID=A0A8X7QKD8_BRACI|nr:hypothetical protein Bca52824_064108 [Brassica carinata]
MARILLAVCLMLLIALSDANKTQRPFSLEFYFQYYPTVPTDFMRYNSNFMLVFVTELEAKCPETAEFKNFFAKLQDYISYCFKAPPAGSYDTQVEMSDKSEQLFRALSALNGTKQGTSFDSMRLIYALVSMEKYLDGMKKRTLKEFDHIKSREVRVIRYVATIGQFVKTVSEMNGKPFDLKHFNIEDGNYHHIFTIKFFNKTIPFSLPNYLKKFPKRGKDFEPFAYRGMFGFVGDLETKAPGSAEFKNFFAQLKEYMNCFKLVSPDSYLLEPERKTEWGSRKLFVAMSEISGLKSETLDPWRLVDGLLSMRKVLVEMKQSNMNPITFEKRKELTWSIVKWARAVNIVVKTACEKQGIYLDLSSFDKYYDSVVLVPSKRAGAESGRNPPNGGNVPKETSTKNGSSN